MRKLRNPLRITIGNLKGGTSRSTSAVYLSLALARRDPSRQVVLVDADAANSTAWDWSEDAGDDWPESVSVMRWPSQHLARRLRHDVDPSAHVIVDTGPHDASVLRQALTATDTLLVPLAPTGNEATRLTPTLQAAAEVAELRPIALAVLLTRVVPQSRSRVGVREAMTGEGLHVLTTEIHRREALAQALGTVPAHLDEYPAVLDELITLSGATR